MQVTIGFYLKTQNYSSPNFYLNNETMKYTFFTSNSLIRTSNANLMTGRKIVNDEVYFKLRPHFNHRNYKLMNKSHMSLEFIFILELLIANFTLKLRTYTTFIFLMPG